jgi:hypothetical protein
MSQLLRLQWLSRTPCTSKEWSSNLIWIWSSLFSILSPQLPALPQRPFYRMVKSVSQTIQTQWSMYLNTPSRHTHLMLRKYPTKEDEIRTIYHGGGLAYPLRSMHPGWNHSSAPGLKFGFTGQEVAITFGPYTTDTTLIALTVRTGNLQPSPPTQLTCWLM